MTPTPDPIAPAVRPWETAENVQCVVCPDCGFTFDADHTDLEDQGHSCPNCMGAADQRYSLDDVRYATRRWRLANQRMAASARLEMVTELHVAVHGSSWGRPESPKAVWESLLKLVIDERRCHDELEAERTEALDYAARVNKQRLDAETNLAQTRRALRRVMAETGTSSLAHHAAREALEADDA